MNVFEKEFEEILFKTPMVEIVDENGNINEEKARGTPLIRQLHKGEAKYLKNFLNNFKMPTEEFKYPRM